MLDRLLKDIVTEQASTYVSTTLPGSPLSPESATRTTDLRPKAFSLARFIPLLRERIYVLNPYTRTYLVSWLTVLDSVPELELVTYLPEFLDGLLKFLGDPSVEIRTVTQNVLADFLRETREVAQVRIMLEEEWRAAREESRPSSPQVLSPQGPTGSDDEADASDINLPLDGEAVEDEGTGAWIPGQGVQIDHAAIVEILLEHLSFPGESASGCVFVVCRRSRPEFLQTKRFSRRVCAGLQSSSSLCSPPWCPLRLD